MNDQLRNEMDEIETSPAFKFFFCVIFSFMCFVKFSEHEAEKVNTEEISSLSIIDYNSEGE